VSEGERIMIPDSVFGGQGPTLNGAAHLVVSSAIPAVVEPGRVDLLRVLTGLRHLAGSTEPGRVFAELAAVCVPALCDDVIVDVERTVVTGTGSGDLAVPRPQRS
jgi:hypothetical protein